MSSSSSRAISYPPLRPARERFVALGGYGAVASRRIRASLDSPTGPDQHRAPCPAASAAAWSWPGSCSPHPTPVRVLRRRCCSTSREPPRRRLGRLAAAFPAQPHRRPGVISHNVDLLADVVNRVSFLDAVAARPTSTHVAEVLDARATDEQRRRRERSNANASHRAAHPGRQWAPKHQSRCAQNMLRRADR